MQKTIIFPIAVVTVLLIGVGGYAYAQNNGLLQGVRTDDNAEFREDVRLQRSIELSKQITLAEPQDRVDMVVEQTNLTIDEMFGIDFSDSKKKVLNDAQRAMLLEKVKNDALYKSGKIPLDEYMRRASKSVERSLNTVAEVLSDDEFATMFGVQKGDIQGAFYKATKFTPKEK
jgi:hypothetical protein